MFKYLHRLRLQRCTFRVLLVHKELLSSNIGIHFRSLCARLVHSVGPRGNVSAVLCIGRRVPDAHELQPPILTPDLGQSDIAVTTEGTHRFGSLEFVRERSFVKDSALDPGAKCQRLAEWRSESINFGPII